MAFFTLAQHTAHARADKAIARGQLALAAGYSSPICILRSAAGFYYIGTFDPQTGPVSRESEEYWSTPQLASDALRDGHWHQRLNP